MGIYGKNVIKLDSNGQMEALKPTIAKTSVIHQVNDKKIVFSALPTKKVTINLQNPVLKENIITLSSKGLFGYISIALKY